MSITNHGFIVKAPAYAPDTHRAVIENPSFRTEIVCVSTMSEAEHAARAMLAAGIEVIELCGGFGARDAQWLTDALATHVPIGFVTFPPVEQHKLERMSAGGKGFTSC